MDAKVHFGEGAPTVRLRWVYTDLPFLPLGTECVINNRKWNQDQESKLTVGQFPPVESNYEQDARWRLPAALKAGHICNPQWLSTGEPWPTDLPDSIVGPPFWIPDCCLFLDPLAGGLEIGGEAGDVYDGPPGPTCLSAKHVALNVTYPDSWPGVVSRWWRWDTVPGQVYSFTTLFAAGLFRGWTLYDGPSCTLLTVVNTGIVGVVNLTHSAFSNHMWAEFSSPIGGFAYSVLLEGPPLFIDPAEGGLEIGGETGDQYGAGEPADGGLEIGGETGDVFSGTDGTEGGLEIGGETGDVYTGPSPGSTCATALMASIPTVYAFTLPAGGTHWLQWPIPPFSVINITVTTGAAGLTADYWFDFSCALGAPWYSGAFVSQGNLNTFFAFLFVRIVNPTGAPISYTIQAF